MGDIAPTKTSAIITLAAIVVIVAGMKAASALIVPFLIATFLALITVRPMLWLQANRVPTFLAALLIVLTLMAALTVLGVLTIGYLDKILSINAVPEAGRLMLTGVIIIVAVLTQRRSRS